MHSRSLGSKCFEVPFPRPTYLLQQWFFIFFRSRTPFKSPFPETAAHLFCEGATLLQSRHMHAEHLCWTLYNRKSKDVSGPPIWSTNFLIHEIINLKLVKRKLFLSCRYYLSYEFSGEIRLICDS